MTTTKIIEQVKCPNPNCAALIGETVDVEGLILLHIGAMLVREMQALCLQCGRTFYWSVSTKSINKVVRLSLTIPDDSDTETGFYLGR